MWDDEGPRSGRGAQRSDPSASRRDGRFSPPMRTSGPRSLPPRDDDPYRPYNPNASARMPTARGPYAGRGAPGRARIGEEDGVGDWTSAELRAVHKHRVGLAIFHDGNPGHLWRAEVASSLAEAALAVGVVMWIAYVTNSPISVALALTAMGLPFLLIRPLVVGLENSADPTRWMRWLGRLRVVAAAGIVAIHFRPIVPALYGLLFVISALGRMRDAARVGAIRTCLAPGEPEHVANDSYIGSVIAGVLGPLIGMLFYILLEEHLLLVGVGCVVFFVISANSDNFLDTLPESRRAFLLANPESLALLGEEGIYTPAMDEDADEDDDEALELRRELALPEWYQQGPTSPGKALADIRAGLGLAGSSGSSAAGLWLLSALALFGGGLASLEVFYVVREIVQPSYFLGPLLAAEGAGLALGFYLAQTLLARAGAKIAAFGGAIGSGCALALLALTPHMPLPLGVTFALGLANAFALAGARHLLLDGFDGIERRALSAAEAWAAPLCAAVGALAFAVLYTGSGAMAKKPSGLNLPSWPIAYMLAMLGAGLAGAAILLLVAMIVLGKPRKVKVKSSAKKKAATKGRGKGRDADLDDGDEDDLDPDDSRMMSASRGRRDWDEDEDDGDSRWAESGVYDDEDAYAASGEYQRSHYDDAADGYDEDDPDDRSWRRNPARRPGGRDHRSRW